MFANKRMLRLKTLATYDTNSIKTSKGAIASGVPLGKNKFCISHLCCTTPIMLIPMKCVAAKKNVITNELVAVKEYGTKPAKFESKIKENKKNKIEKY